VVSRKRALGDLWSRLVKYFPEHQIYLRTNGKVRFLTLPSGFQVALCGLALIVVGWMTLATWTYFRENTRLAAKDAKLDAMRGQVKAMASDLDVLQRDIIEQAETLEARQELLQSVLEQGLGDGLVPVEAQDSPDSAAQPAAPADDGDSARQESREERKAALEHAQAAPGQLAALYQSRYARIAQSQEAVAEKLLDVTQHEFRLVKTALAGLHLNPEHFLRSQRSPTQAMGGPFIPATLRSATPAANETTDAVDQLLDEWQRLLYIRHALLSVPALVPVDHYFVSSNYGRRRDPMTNGWAMHSGIDLAAWYGTKVKAATDGVVVRAGYMSGYGRMVEIDHGNGFKTRYGHLRKVLVKKGQTLSIGDIIGESGNTGRSTGPHLHYEIWLNGKPVDPKPYIEASDHVLKIQRRSNASG